jgi:signal transduction histidine kinase
MTDELDRNPDGRPRPGPVSEEEHQAIRGLLAADVLSRLRDVLEEREASHVVVDELSRGMQQTVMEIIDDTLLLIDGPAHLDQAYSVDYLDPDYKLTAEANARHNVHPAEALMVAELIFDLALPVFADLATQRGVSIARVAQLLHRSIWKRFPPGAINYTNHLRQRVYQVERDTKMSLSRELHDRVAHRVLVALQKLELMQLRVPDLEAADMLRDTEADLRLAVDEVREMATQLRVQMGGRSLEDAIRLHGSPICGDIPFDVHNERHAEGTPAWQLEELLAIALEAIRNAVRHGAPERIQVLLAGDGMRLTMTVKDDGDGMGFDTAAGLGMQGMHERAELLGADLKITSTPSEGTLVRVVLEALTPTGRVLRGRPRLATD